MLLSPEQDRLDLNLLGLKPTASLGKTQMKLKGEPALGMGHPSPSCPQSSCTPNPFPAGAKVHRVAEKQPGMKVQVSAPPFCSSFCKTRGRNEGNVAQGERLTCLVYENRDNKAFNSNKPGFNKRQRCRKVWKIRKADRGGTTFFSSWMPRPGDAHGSRFLTIYKVQIHSS